MANARVQVPPPKSPEELPQSATSANTTAPSTTAELGHGSSSMVPQRHRETSASTKDIKPTSQSDVSGHAEELSQSSASTGGTPKKAKFMDKVKGEVKVIGGKITHNEEKIEEGKRMMGKE